jgi:tetratricopeptide (TPR) repeat protein
MPASIFTHFSRLSTRTAHSVRVQSTPGLPIVMSRRGGGSRMTRRATEIKPMLEKVMTRNLQDRRGLEVSTRDADALALYEEAAELAHGYYVDPIAVADRALERDPQFAMAHCLKAAIGVMGAEQAGLPLIDASVRAVEALGAQATDRERAHAAAARAWLEGDFERAAQRYGDIVLEHPHDLLALQSAHLIDFYTGESSLLRDRIAQVLGDWNERVPGYGYVLGMYAFGLEETAAYSRAEDAGLKALDLNPRDPWAVHAVAHVMEMQGRIGEGIEFLNRTAGDWAPGNGLAFHQWWHLALYHLDRGEAALAVELYDTKIHPAATQVALELVDATSLLWRLRLRGVDVGNRWADVAEGWAGTAEDGFYAFNDVHALISYLASGRDCDAERVLETLGRRAGDLDTNGRMSRDVGAPLGRGIAALARGHAGTAIEQILPMRTRAHRFGGSHAQRDLVHLTLIEAAFAAQDFRRARALIAERTAAKPTSPFNWRLAERAHRAMGQGVDAAAAAGQAELRERIQGFKRVA